MSLNAVDCDIQRASIGHVDALVSLMHELGYRTSRETMERQLTRYAESEHPQYTIFMSAADMARFGMLYLHEGRWHDKQVIPREWIQESVSPLSVLPGGSTRPADHFGYSWWIDADQNVVWAAGWGGQFMTIDRDRRLVVVTRQGHGPLSNRSMEVHAVKELSNNEAPRGHSTVDT